MVIRPLGARTGAGSVPVAYEYDAASRMTNLIDGEGNQTVFAYDGGSRLTQKTYADSTYYLYSYSDRSWLTNQAIRVGP